MTMKSVARRARVSLFVGIVVVAGGLLTMSAPASAGIPIDDSRIKVAKKPGGPYRPGIIEADIGVGKTKDFFFKVKNPTSDDGVALLSGFVLHESFKFRFFRGGQNITMEMHDGDHVMNLSAGQTKQIEMIVKRKAASQRCGGITELHTNTFAVVAFNGADCLF